MFLFLLFAGMQDDQLYSIKLAHYYSSWLRKGDGPTLITKLMSQDAHHITCFHEKRFLNFYDFILFQN